MKREQRKENGEKRTGKKNGEKRNIVKGELNYSPFIILVMSSPTSEVVLLPPMS